MGQMTVNDLFKCEKPKPISDFEIISEDQKNNDFFEEKRVNNPRRAQMIDTQVIKVDTSYQDYAKYQFE